MFNKRRTWIVILLAVGFVVLGAIWIFCFHSREFDPVAWQDKTQIKKGIRLEMADDLIAKGTLRGMNRTEVVKLLGEPPETPYFKEWDLVYWLGIERSDFGIDSEWLVVSLDTDSRVQDYRIVRD